MNYLMRTSPPVKTTTFNKGDYVVWAPTVGGVRRFLPGVVRELKNHTENLPGGAIKVIPGADVAIPVAPGKRRRQWVPLAELTLDSEFVPPQFAQFPVEMVSKGPVEPGYATIE